ncbi:MAG: pseudouridylate synthase [Crocinitomicaceae bacterium]
MQLNEINNQHVFDFKTDISTVNMPDILNNPFGNWIPEIGRMAAKEFQAFIATQSINWTHDFSIHKGKMFGVLVIQCPDDSYGYLGTVSGKLEGNTNCPQFVPSVFNDSTGNYFINKEMRALTEMGKTLKNEHSPVVSNALKIERKQKSLNLQQWLFKQYRFLNLLGVEQDVLEIFKQSPHANPPAAAGECAAPKLLQYALKQQLKPIAIAEFWWGASPKGMERKHESFYPACKSKCRPILEFMLDNYNLYNKANQG